MASRCLGVNPPKAMFGLGGHGCQLKRSAIFQLVVHEIHGPLKIRLRRSIEGFPDAGRQPALCAPWQVELHGARSSRTRPADPNASVERTLRRGREKIHRLDFRAQTRERPLISSFVGVGGRSVETHPRRRAFIWIFHLERLRGREAKQPRQEHAREGLTRRVITHDRVVVGLPRKGDFVLR